MAEIINLRNVRKQKARASREAQAVQNRALFGRTKPEKDRQKAEDALSARRLDGHLRAEDD